MDAPDLERIYIEHADFMWACLARLGVRDGDIEDVLHEVFLVIHRRLGSFSGDKSLRAWLFAICRRAAANYRRVARYSTEQSLTSLADFATSGDIDSPERAARVSEAMKRFERVLAAMSDDKRMIFVMFEIELMSADEIGNLLSIPVGTVYSRLHSARRQFQLTAAQLGLSTP